VHGNVKGQISKLTKMTWLSLVFSSILQVKWERLLEIPRSHFFAFQWKQTRITPPYPSAWTRHHRKQTQR